MMHKQKVFTAGVLFVSLIFGSGSYAGPITTEETGAEVFARMLSLLDGKVERIGSTGRASCKLKLITGSGRSAGWNRIVLEVEEKEFSVSIAKSTQVTATKGAGENSEFYEQYRYSFGGLPVAIGIYTDSLNQDFAVELVYENINKSSYCYFRE